MAQARKRAGLTQAQVARRMGTTASAVCRMESESPGNLTLETLDRYAGAVGAEFSLSIRPVH
jgi:transcriptional regulator with XRE-family HTH domain